MSIVIAAGIGFLAILFTVVPLFRQVGDEPVGTTVEEETSRDRLHARREVVYDSIRDLEFELAMGKLTKEDYGEIRAELVDDAARILEEIDAEGPDEVLDRWIEVAVEGRRRGAVCAGCGKGNPRGARFCDGCGAGLDSGCESCGAKLRPDAQFCGDCGRAVGGKR